MDTKSLSFNFGEGELEKAKEIQRRLGDSVAYFEVAAERVSTWQRDMEELMANNQIIIDNQLAEIRQATEELREIMTEAGAARWRIAAEAALQQGKDHLRSLDSLSQDYLQSLHSSNEEFNKHAKKSFDRLDRAATYTIKNISEAISSFRIGDFQRLTDHTCEMVEETSHKAINRLGRLVKWFHWKNVGLAFAITMFVSLTMGLYLNDEMPWETHKKVVMQRNAGDALIKAWPTLSQAERKHIIEHTNKTITDSETA